jgi:hypothetical protein
MILGADSMSRGDVASLEFLAYAVPSMFNSAGEVDHRRTYGSRICH